MARAGAALRLRLGQVLEVLSRKQHCFTLGFSSLAADVLERCERSVRWVEGARCLARRLEALPALRRSLARGELPWSAIELVARIAEPQEEQRWLETGVAGAIQTSAAPSRASAKAGRVELRLRVPRHLFAWWRGLEAQARRWLPRSMSWLKFLCVSSWHAWRHLLGANVAYGAIYLRDTYRCRSPVCCRRDVTPHHLRFRSQGGGDESENLASVCSWCHLFGIHAGRIRAHGTSGSIHWELGPLGRPCVVVHGRERQRGQALNLVQHDP